VSRPRLTSHQREADRAFAKFDTLFERGHDAAAVRAVQEGRRLQATADRYRALAVKDGES
jgi:hypothetical protein